MKRSGRSRRKVNIKDSGDMSRSTRKRRKSGDMQRKVIVPPEEILLNDKLSQSSIGKILNNPPSQGPRTPTYNTLLSPNEEWNFEKDWASSAPVSLSRARPKRAEETDQDEASSRKTPSIQGGQKMKALKDQADGLKGEISPVVIQSGPKVASRERQNEKQIIHKDYPWMSLLHSATTTLRDVPLKRIREGPDGPPRESQLKGTGESETSPTKTSSPQSSQPQNIAKTLGQGIVGDLLGPPGPSKISSLQRPLLKNSQKTPSQSSSSKILISSSPSREAWNFEQDWKNVAKEPSEVQSGGGQKLQTQPIERSKSSSSSGDLSNARSPRVEGSDGGAMSRGSSGRLSTLGRPPHEPEEWNFERDWKGKKK